MIFLVLMLFSLAVCAAGTVALERYTRFGGVFVLLSTVVLFIVPLVSPTNVVFGDAH